MLLKMYVIHISKGQNNLFCSTLLVVAGSGFEPSQIWLQRLHFWSLPSVFLVHTLGVVGCLTHSQTRQLYWALSAGCAVRNRGGCSRPLSTSLWSLLPSGVWTTPSACLCRLTQFMYQWVWTPCGHPQPLSPSGSRDWVSLCNFTCWRIWSAQLKGSLGISDHISCGLKNWLGLGLREEIFKEQGFWLRRQLKTNVVTWKALALCIQPLELVRVWNTWAVLRACSVQNRSLPCFQCASSFSGVYSKAHYLSVATYVRRYHNYIMIPTGQ